MKEIPLSQGLVALVDDRDYERATEIGPWHAVDCRGHKYARHCYRDQLGLTRYVYLHTWLLMEALVDHINSDGLDNRRANLRPATGSQNNANARRSRSNTSGFKGVNYYRRTGRWRASIGGICQTHLGYFLTAEEAAHAYDAAAIDRWGEYALTNFPPTPIKEQS